MSVVGNTWRSLSFVEQLGLGLGLGLSAIHHWQQLHSEFKSALCALKMDVSISFGPNVILVNFLCYKLSKQCVVWILLIFLTMLLFSCRSLPLITGNYFLPDSDIFQRFYGKSLPFGERQSFLHPYVDLLTAEQAMADFAVLITSLKSYLNAENSAVIAFGGRLVLVWWSTTKH